jgi:hypothetical protein
MHKLSTAAAILLASVSGQSQADVTFYDNSDLAFLFSPFEPRAAFGPGTSMPLLVQTTLYPLSSPADNADNTGVGFHTFSYKINRNPPSGSSVEEDWLRGAPSASVRFGYTGNWLPNSAELTTLEVGDTVDESVFTTSDDFFEHLGSVATYQLGTGLIPLYGDEAYIPFSLDETDGIRYGYIRITFMQDVEFDIVDEFNQPTGQTTLRDLYMVTGWGFETELDTPLVITDGSTPHCPADTNGDGAVTPADFSAWVAAFNTNAPECDQNDDNACTPADFSAWVANYNAGC